MARGKNMARLCGEREGRESKRGAAYQEWRPGPRDWPGERRGERPGERPGKGRAATGVQGRGRGLPARRAL